MWRGMALGRAVSHRAGRWRPAGARRRPRASGAGRDAAGCGRCSARPSPPPSRPMPPSASPVAGGEAKSGDEPIGAAPLRRGGRSGRVAGRVATGEPFRPHRHRRRGDPHSEDRPRPRRRSGDGRNITAPPPPPMGAVRFGARRRPVPVAPARHAAGRTCAAGTRAAAPGSRMAARRGRASRRERRTRTRGPPATSGTAPSSSRIVAHVSCHRGAGRASLARRTRSSDPGGGARRPPPPMDKGRGTGASTREDRAGASAGGGPSARLRGARP